MKTLLGAGHRFNILVIEVQTGVKAIKKARKTKLKWNLEKNQE